MSCDFVVIINNDPVFSSRFVYLQAVPVSGRGNGLGLHRQKREWIIAPRQLKENHDYTGLDSIARVGLSSAFLF